MSFYISIEWMGYITAHRTITDLMKTATDLFLKTKNKIKFQIMSCLCSHFQWSPQCQSKNQSVHQSPTPCDLPAAFPVILPYSSPHSFRTPSLFAVVWAPPACFLLKASVPPGSSAPDTSMTHPSHWGHLWPSRSSEVTTIPNLKPSLLSHLA